MPLNAETWCQNAHCSAISLAPRVKRRSRLSYAAWESSIPAEVRADPLWGLRVYRAALYAGDLGRREHAGLRENPGSQTLPRNWCARPDRSARTSPKDTAAMAARIACDSTAYALGSARESRDWYYKARDALGAPRYTSSHVAPHVDHSHHDQASAQAERRRTARARTGRLLIAVPNANARHESCGSNPAVSGTSPAVSGQAVASFTNFSATELMQYLNPVGFGPSSNTCP